MSVCLSFCPSVCPHGTTQLPLDGFSCTFMFEDFSKICWVNSRYIQIGQEQRVIYMKTNIHFRSYLAHFFLEWEMFQKKAVEKIKTLFFVQKPFFRKSCQTWDDVEIFCGSWQATDDNMAHAHLMLGTYGYKYTYPGCVILIVFPSNNACTNGPQCYVIRALPVLLKIKIFWWMTLCLSVTT
jgi:hypothetical protein